MAFYVFDTDVLTHYRAGHPVVCRRVAAHPPSELFVTVISAEQQLTGWYTLLRQARLPDQLERAYDRLAETIQYYAGTQILQFHQRAIARYQ